LKRGVIKEKERQGGKGLGQNSFEWLNFSKNYLIRKRRDDANIESLRKKNIRETTKKE